MSTTNTSWTAAERLKHFSNETWSKNWACLDGLELTTVDISLENWTDIDDFKNDTNLNISSIYLHNASKNALSTIEENSPPVLTYTLLGLNAFFLAFGLFGNTAAVIVMLRSTKELKTHTLLVAVLAITDIGVLVINSFHLLPSPLVFNFDTRAMTEIGCTIFKTVELMLKTMSAYITVLICIDRFIAVQYPLQYRRIVSRKAGVMSLCVCGGVAFFVGVVASSKYSEIENGICQLDPSAHKTLHHSRLLFMIMAALVTAIPLVILLSLTPVIIFKINQRQAIRTRLITKEDAARLIRTTVMLICIVVAYIILVGVPTVVRAAFKLGWVEGYVSNQIMLLILVTAVQINHSINLAFYLSNVEFREQLMRLFECCCSASHPDEEHGQAMSHHVKVSMQ